LTELASVPSIMGHKVMSADTMCRCIQFDREKDMSEIEFRRSPGGATKTIVANPPPPVLPSL
jgi:hypothetical protein